MQAALQKVVSAEASSVDVPVRFITKRTQTVWTLVTLLINHKAVEERTQIVVQAQQLTKFHKFPEVLLGEPEILRTVFKDLSVGSAVLELGGPKNPFSVICANSVFCEKLGLREEELIGKALTEFLHEDDREKTSKAVQEKITSHRDDPHYQIPVRIILRNQPKKEEEGEEGEILPGTHTPHSTTTATITTTVHSTRCHFGETKNCVMRGALTWPICNM